jgi:hypothetical protein
MAGSAISTFQTPVPEALKESPTSSWLVKLRA